MTHPSDPGGRACPDCGWVARIYTDGGSNRHFPACPHFGEGYPETSVLLALFMNERERYRRTGHKVVQNPIKDADWPFPGMTTRIDERAEVFGAGFGSEGPLVAVAVKLKGTTPTGSHILVWHPEQIS